VQSPQRLDHSRRSGQPTGLRGEDDLSDVHDGEKSGDGRRAQRSHARPPPALLAVSSCPYRGDEREESDHPDREQAERNDGGRAMVQEVSADLGGPAPKPGALARMRF
jgi:hypothetical protein